MNCNHSRFGFNLSDHTAPLLLAATLVIAITKAANAQRPAILSPPTAGVGSDSELYRNPSQPARASQFGPKRTDPAQGGPRHAYSPFDEANKPKPYEPKPTDYIQGSVVVKLKPQVNVNLQAALAPLRQRLALQGVERLDPIFPGANPAIQLQSLAGKDAQARPDLSRWFKAQTATGADVQALAAKLAADPDVEVAGPDFIRRPVGQARAASLQQANSSSAAAGLPSAGTDPLYAQQWHLAAAKVPEAWAYLESQGLPPGGSRDVVVAVIDTGVDINHLDLAANIWTNSREIAGNGLDDDNDGFVDDVHGVDVITGTGNPMDDHGHGTHVAGIIAAQASNGQGGVGVAYNVQIMPIKAAQYSGVLASSDVAKAVNYAVAHGADIINMSFGGYARSQIEEDALAVAFGQCVLVAAAGNDGYHNEPCDAQGSPRPMYPAAYNWVLGVMARTQNPDSKGNYLAGFSNFDGVPSTKVEYELMAPGVDVWSTLPNNQYAAWDGTSMAAPIVSGMAALARTKWSNKDTYSSRFIMGQIATTGGSLQGRLNAKGEAVSYHVSDALAALTITPKPQLAYLELWLFDTTQQAANDDNDGIVDAGETVDLAVVIRNQWGQANQVSVKLEAWAEGAVQADPYVTWTTDTVDYGAIGSFNWDDNGLIYDVQQTITGVRNPFRFSVSASCPNNHLIPFRVTMTARNGLDPQDSQVYTSQSRFSLMVQRGRELPRIISQDMTLTKDDFWLVPNQVLIESGATLRVTEGTQIQFWSTDPNKPYTGGARALWQVEGNLFVQGSADDPVELFNSPAYPAYPVVINVAGSGAAEMRYARVLNPKLGADVGVPFRLIDHCYFEQEGLTMMLYIYQQGDIGITGPDVNAVLTSSSVHRKLGYRDFFPPESRFGRFTYLLSSAQNLFDSCDAWIQPRSAQGNVFLKNYRESKQGKVLESWAVNAGFLISATNSARAVFPEVREGKTYFAVSSLTGFDGAEAFAQQLGGHLVAINDATENQFVRTYLGDLQNRVRGAYANLDSMTFSGSGVIGLVRQGTDGPFLWTSSELMAFTNWTGGAPSPSWPATSARACAVQSWGTGEWEEIQIDRTNPWNPYLLEVPGSLTQADLDAAREVFLRQPTCGTFKNNAILNYWWDPRPDRRLWFKVMPNENLGNRGRDARFYIGENYWGTTSATLIEGSIWDYQDDFNLGRYVWEPVLTEPPADCYPFVVNVSLSTGAGANMAVVGAEPVTFRVTFNRDMNTSVQPQVSFGPDTPLTDYTVHPIGGGWQDPRTWAGTFNITPTTGDGYQLVRVAGAVVADDPWLVTGDDAGRFRFEIISSGTESMNLQATGGEGKVELSWMQDDFELLAGYNLYRSTNPSNNFARINSSIVPTQQKSYRDSQVQPGQPYYYKFTVIKTDMGESDFSNVAQGTPLDTIPPVIAHTPLTSAPPGLPLTLSADVTDNVGVQGVTLFYRTIGGGSYASRAMTKTTGDRYSATVEGSRLVSPGLEYYLEATDGVSAVRSGRAELPWQITVVDKPVVTTVTPNHGSSAGGAAVTIAGANFKTGAKVSFGGVPASDVVVVSGSQITCTSPPHFPATVDVTVSDPSGQSGVLLRSYGFQSDAASVSLPNTGGGRSAIVEVPVAAANFNGLASAAFTVKFDASVLRGRTARTGSLTPGWNVVINTNTAGELRVAMASTGGPISGSGVLANLELEVLGSPGANSALQLVGVSLNDGAIPAQTADGSFAVGLVYDVSGKTTFWKNGSPVPGVQLALQGNRVYAGQSQTNGSYRVAGADTGNYTLTPAKSDGVGGITAYDASLALQHDARLITLSGSAGTAADVDKSGKVTSLDAFYILQKAVDLISLPFAGAGVVWDFSPTNRVYTNLSGSQVNQDFTAILLGDVSGNWPGVEGQSQAARPALALQGRQRATATPALIGLFTSANGLSRSNEVRVLLRSDQPQVYSVDLRLTYSPTNARVTKVRPGWLSGTMLLVSNTNVAGEIRAGLATATPIAGDGSLLEISFESRPADLQIAGVKINEGEIPVQVVSSLAAFNSVPVVKEVQVDGARNVTLRCSAVPGRTYRLQYKNRLSDATWQQLGSDLVAGADLATFSDSAAGSPGQRYYQVMLVE